MIESNLKKARKNLNLTLNEAASRCGIAPQYLSELERSIKKNPRIKTLANIVKAYNDKSILEDYM